MKFVFFGSSDLSIYVLEELLIHKIEPEFIITTPDKPKGRKLILTPNIVKVWALDHNIPVLDPASLKNNPDLISKLQTSVPDLFLVASYGKIIPPEIFEIPKYKTLNIHPSLLPKYRGASPIISQILNGDTEVGVSLMQIEETMDTGPIFGKTAIEMKEIIWRHELEKILAIEGAKLFAEIAPKWIQGEINPKKQNEKEVTYCSKIKKEDGQINLEDDPHKNLLKIKAFEEWPTTYFFLNGKRIIITDAKTEDGKLKILKVIPEGKKEMLYEDFLRGRNL